MLDEGIIPFSLLLFNNSSKKEAVLVKGASFSAERVQAPVSLRAGGGL